MSKSQKNDESIEVTTMDHKTRAAGDETARTGSGPILLGRVLAEEFKEITGKEIVGQPDIALTVDGKPSTGPSLDSVFKQFHAANLKALCFSGGGIRSATFGLGIAQKLAERGLLEKFDYLSTVSGGGYLGSWMSAWIRRERVIDIENLNKDVQTIQLDDRPGLRDSMSAERNTIDDTRKFRETGIKAVQEKINCIENNSTQFPTPEADPLRHLREYSNYMSPRVGLLSADTWTLVGTYLRNLFLNWTILIPLIAAVLLIPRLLYALAERPQLNSTYAFLAISLTPLIGSVAIAFVLSRLPSRNSKGDETAGVTEKWVLSFGVLPLVLMAFAMTTLWAWKLKDPPAIAKLDSFIDSPFLGHPLTVVIFGTVIAFIAGYLIQLVAAMFSKRIKPSFSWRTGLATLVSAVTGAVILWWAATSILVPENFTVTNGYKLPLYVSFAVPLFLLIFLVAASLFVGLASRSITDEDREWLARYGAWILIVSVVWIVANVLVLIAPSGLEKLIAMFSEDSNWPKFYASIVSAIGVVSGVLSLVGGFSEKSLTRNEPVQSKTSRILALAPKPAAAVFLIFIIVGLAYLTTTVLFYVGQAIGGSLIINGTSLEHRAMLDGSSIRYLLVSLAVLAVIGLTMAFFVNVNKFSLHGAYRDRLIRAYLGASNFFRQRNSFTGFDDADNFQLHRLRGQRPFHVINATLNLVRGKNLAWQNRKAASFTMSPLHCGSWLVGYRNTNEYCRNTKLGDCKSREFCNRKGDPCKPDEKCELPGKALRIGTAMAISGAAANPNMGYISSPIVTFLMSLFNIRLGWWLGNTGDAGSGRDWFGWGKSRFFEKASPSIAVFPLINETLGRTDEDKRFIMVTDGGHFENLALYEMILRRCRFIVLSDGAADHAFKFGEISNAIQKCKVDLGVDIRFKDGIKIVSRDTDADGKKEAARYAIADITYPEKDDKGNNLTGCLLYTRPAYYEDEYTDVRYYADSNPGFPHQSTGDQMYDEKQFEAYRGLGFFTMDKIIGTDTYTGLDQLMKKVCGGARSKDETGSSPQPLPELLCPE